MTRRLFSKTALFAALAVASLAGSSVRAQQGDSGPAVILTAKSAGELIADLRFLAGSMMKPDDPQGAQVLGMLDALKNPQALQGLDPSKPLGAFGSLPDGDKPPTAVIFLPVLDGQKVLDSLAGTGATVEADNTSPGFTHKIQHPAAPFPIFVTQGGGYMYLSLAPVNAVGLKAMKPATLLPKRTGAGDLSLTLRLDRIPAAMKQQFYDAFEAQMAPQREKQPGEDEAHFQGRITSQTLGQEMIVALVRDSKDLSLDLLIDPKTDFAGLELNSSAVPGSEYGKNLRKLASLKSRFRSMTANAAMGGYATLPVPQGLRDLMGKVLDMSIEETKKNPNTSDEGVQKLIADITPALRDLLTSETIDLGAAFQGPTSGTTPTYAAAAGMAVKGGKRFEKVIRDAVKSMPADKSKDIKLDFAKATDGTAIHKITSSDAADAGPLGEPLIFAAVRDDVIAIGMGKTGQAALNTVLAAGKTPAAATSATAPQVELLMSVSKLANLEQDAAKKEATLAAVKQVFTGTAAKKDKISLVLKGQGDAMSLRVGMDVPALKFFARMNEISNGQ